MQAGNEQTIYCTPQTIDVQSDICLADLTEVVASKPLPAILGGNDSVEGVSVFTAEPLEIFEFSLQESKPFEKLQQILSKYKLVNHSNIKTRGFNCGWIGYFGYELSRFIEKLPATTIDDLGFPVIRLGFYDKAILYDHQTRQFAFNVLDCDREGAIPEEKFAVLNGWLNEATTATVPVMKPADIEAVSMGSVGTNMTQKEYLDAVARIKYYIIEGDTYQINFSQRFEKLFDGRPVDVFHWQNKFNPSPFAAYLAWGEKAVVSASPELFLKIDGHSIMTKPIKGTRPRNPLLPDDSVQNSEYFHELVASEKDQAELAMIVDLERNDLARVCVPGTRYVKCLREIESFPTVYHAAATIQGQLALQPGSHRIIEILKATFPGGSVTGAPKIRSMEIIDELEPTARNVYTGSVGWIGLNGDLCWNIAIRTILLSENRAYIQAGGGIVADSDPVTEWNEVWTKARALLAGVDAVHVPKC